MPPAQIQENQPRTMESLNLLQEPLEPTAIEAKIDELFERTALVHLWIMCELRSLDQVENDRIFEPNEDGPDAIQR
jgi:hypothetical protein